jgi:hypothetical protein
MFIWGTMLSDSMVTTAGHVPQIRYSASAIPPTTATSHRRSRASETAQCPLVLNCTIRARMPVCSLFSAILLLLLDVTVNIPYRSVNRGGAIKSDADMTGTRLKTHIPIPMRG